MYHDTVSLSVSSRLSCVLCFSVCTRASLVLFGLSNTRLSLPIFSLKILCRKCSMQKRVNWKATRITSGTAYSGEVRSSLCCCRPGGNLALFPVLSTRLEIWNSRAMYLDLSRGMKVNEFADLITSEFVSEYPEENPDIVWSGGKHLETHEYINEPLDQVEPDSCFQSSDEGPSLFFLLCVELELELNCR